MQWLKATGAENIAEIRALVLRVTMEDWSIRVGAFIGEPIPSASDGQHFVSLSLFQGWTRHGAIWSRAEKWRNNLKSLEEDDFYD